MTHPLIRKITAFSLATASLALLPAAALAQNIDAPKLDRVRDSKNVTLDPSKAYLMIESEGMFISTWFRVPDEDMRAEWESQRQEEFAEAQEDYARDLAQYERDQQRHAPNRFSVERPVQPTPETFAWPELETTQVFTVGPQNRFSSGEVSLWLYEVPAGNYVFYGTGVGPQSIDCACMGSVAFAVPEGQVTAVRVTLQPLDRAGNAIGNHVEDSDSTDKMVRRAPLVEAPSRAAYDPRLPAGMVVPADFMPVPSLTSWFGGTINRVMPIDGVLAYDGIVQVDLRSGE